MLGIIQTHPVQYHAPIFRALQQRFGIPVTAIYGSDCSVVGYHDLEFGETIAWDTDLLSGYTSVFLSQVAKAGAGAPEDVSPRGLRKALAHAGPKAVLLMGHSPHFHGFYQTAFFHAWRARIPILLHVESTDHVRPRSRIHGWMRDRVSQWFYRRCARLLYVGQRTHQHCQRLGCPDGHLVSSPYGVDTTPFHWDEAARARFRPRVRQRLGLAESQRALLFSGKLSQRKGVDLLLQAVQQLPSAIREGIAVLFMGNGELRETLERLAHGPPSVNTLFLGFQNQTDLSQYYQAADLLVLPSRHSETWGLVVNEALHHGLPCVVSDAVGCAPDLIEPGVTGEICQSGSAKSLALGIERALRLSGRPDIRARCRQKMSGFALEHSAAGIAEAYRASIDGTTVV